MTLNLFTDYALRVLMYAALPGMDRFSLDSVSHDHGISRDHVAKVVQFLVKKGYLATKRGRGGGITLARKPEEITVGAVIRDTEGSAPLIQCFQKQTENCRWGGRCRLQNVLGDALDAFYAVLDRATLAELVENPRELRDAFQAA